MKSDIPDASKELTVLCLGHSHWYCYGHHRRWYRWAGTWFLEEIPSHLRSMARNVPVCDDMGPACCDYGSGSGVDCDD